MRLPRATHRNIYVRSERAGLRVMASVEKFIRTRLRLRVNFAKSAVARPETRHFLGFRLREAKGGPEVLLSERSVNRIRERIRELTPRPLGRSLSSIISTINGFLKGWSGFFKPCSPCVESWLRNLDSHLRRRLRAVILKQWKRKRTIAKSLIRLGLSRKIAWKRVCEGKKGFWALSRTRAVETALRNSFFEKLGLFSLGQHFKSLWRKPTVPTQLTLDWDTARS